jgi:hypothetical protein
MPFTKDEHGNIVTTDQWVESECQEREARWGRMLDRFIPGCTGDDRRLTLLLMDETAQRAGTSQPGLSPSNWLYRAWRWLRAFSAR